MKDYKWNDRICVIEVNDEAIILDIVDGLYYKADEYFAKFINACFKEKSLVKAMSLLSDEYQIDEREKNDILTELLSRGWLISE